MAASRLLAILFLGVVAACASEPARNARYEALLDQWIGKPTSELAKAWGAPQVQQKLDDGSTLMTYRRGRTVYIPGDVGAPVIATRGGAVLVGNTSPTVVRGVCTTRFTANAQGVLTRWDYEGSHC